MEMEEFYSKKKKPRFGSANELGELDRPSPSQDRILEVEVVFRGCKVEKEKRGEKKKKGIVGQPCNRPPADGNVVTVDGSRSTGEEEREREREPTSVLDSSMGGGRGTVQPACRRRVLATWAE